jgi:predicted PurR-regulated permease PerM
VKMPESGLRRTFYVLGSLVASGALLYWGRPVLIPITIAVLVTFVLAPIVARLERWGIPRFIACGVSVLGAAVVVVGIGYIFVQQARSLTSELPAYKTQIAEKISNLRQASAESWMASVVDFANELTSPPSDHGGAAFARLEIPVVPVIQSVAGTTLEILINAVLVAVLALLMLMRREDLRNRVIHLMGSDNLVSATRLMDEASKRVSRFLLAQLIINLGFGAAVAIGLALIGLPYAYVWGALAAVLRYIPFLGGWIAAAFPLLASLVMADWTPFFLTGLFFIVVELLQANLVEPLVFGRSIGVSGVGQLVAILFWACLWGPVGLILSTPLTAWLCVMGRHFPVLSFFSSLVGEEDGVEKPAAFYQRLLAGDLAEASELAEEFLKDHPVPAIYDELFIPALRSGQSDYKQGELTKEDYLAINDAVEETFLEVAMPVEKEPQVLSAKQDAESPPVLVLKLPFNDDTDTLILEMLRKTTASGYSRWSHATFKNGSLDGLSPAEDDEPGVIVLATSVSKNLVRLRGACKTVRDLFPDARILVACWSIENNNGAVASRLKEAGASVICATFLEARQFIDSGVSGRALPVGQLAH